MMKLLTPRQMKTIDGIAIRSLGIPGIILMENAAIQVAKKASELLKGKCEPHVTIVAGIGNNGGDAFAVTRHLLSMGYTVSAFSITGPDDLTGDALTNRLILKNLGMDIPVLSEEGNLDRLKNSCKESDLVIDGLLGTGLNRDVEGLWAEVIEIINNYSPYILSIDIASGIDGLSGKVRGTCVKADETVTFYLPKIGMAQYPGASFIGRLTVADIGIPYALADDFETTELMGKDDIRGMLPIRPRDSHKGVYGKLLMIAGSVGMTGAAYLSALSAYRTGTGIVRLAVPEGCVAPLSILIPEAVISVVPENPDRIPGFIKELIEDADAVLAGPGLSCGQNARVLLQAVIESCSKPMVLDADALNIIAGNKHLLDNLLGEAVITPHPAEMSRLAGISVSSVQEDRIGGAKRFADEYGLTVVLKGAGTVIAANDGRTAVNPTGNEGMSTAGAGDVLAGIITSLLGQGLPPYEAAAAGTYLHGLAGDMASEERGSAGLIASDVAASIPNAFKYIMGDGI